MRLTRGPSGLKNSSRETRPGLGRRSPPVAIAGPRPLDVLHDVSPSHPAGGNEDKEAGTLPLACGAELRAHELAARVSTDPSSGDPQLLPLGLPIFSTHVTFPKSSPEAQVCFPSARSSPAVAPEPLQSGYLVWEEKTKTQYSALTFVDGVGIDSLAFNGRGVRPAFPEGPQRF